MAGKRSVGKSGALVDASGFLDGEIFSVVDGHYSKILAPETGIEVLATEYAALNLGGHVKNLPGKTAKEARDLARQLSAVRLPKFGITDRHIKVESGMWQVPGKPIPTEPQLLIQVIAGARPTSRKPKSDPVPQPVTDYFTMGK
jgi:hypothetical protein